MEKWEGWILITMVSAIPIGIISLAGSDAYSKRLQADVKLACYEVAKINHNITCEKENVHTSK